MKAINLTLYDLTKLQPGSQIRIGGVDFVWEVDEICKGGLVLTPAEREYDPDRFSGPHLHRLTFDMLLKKGVTRV